MGPGITNCTPATGVVGVEVMVGVRVGRGVRVAAGFGVPVGVKEGLTVGVGDQATGEALSM